MSGRTCLLFSNLLFGNLLFAGPLLLAGCSRDAGNPAPPRIVGEAQLPEQTSTITVPVTTDLAQLEEGLNAEMPRQLWTIDRHEDRCVAARRVNLGIGKVKLTPDLGCRILGQVTRGRIKLGGSGDRLTIILPVQAEITAKDIGGIATKTATGAATVRAVAHLSLRSDWEPAAKVDIAYDWTEPPGVDFLGKRITFVGKADERLRGVIAKLERDLPRQLAKLRLRAQLAGVWRQAFTSIELSRDHPPAWMRIAPRRLGFGGYRIVGRQLRLTLSAEALTQTFVGAKPADPPPIPLPSPSRTVGAPGLRFYIPVLADYRQLEPVVQRTLRKLAAKGITLKGVGPVDAEFGKVTVYATTGNRLAVGVEARVNPRGGSFGATRGEAWLSALPYNAAGSQLVRARDVQFATRTDSTVVNLLVSLFADTTVQATIADALSHDFAPDYRKVLDKAQAAIGDRQEGDFVLRAHVTKVTNGAIRATAAGLFLPVAAEGEARIAFRPR